MKNLISIAILACAAATSASAQVTATAISEATGVLGGGSFRIGVRFEMDPGWYIYWKYPGDSGLPTEITATAPEGVEVGPWRFPVPEQFGQPGGITGFGYADEVLIIADVEMSAALEGELTIGLVADWLMCKDRCIPGRRELSVTVELLPPLSSLAMRASEHRNTFDAWEARVPDAVNERAPFSLNVQPSDAAGTLTITWPDGAPDNVNWIPNPPFELGIEKIHVHETPQATTITFTWEKWGTPPSPTLQSLLSWTDAAGERRGHDLQFDLY